VDETLPPDVQAAVDQALSRVEEVCAADPDLVHGDAVEQVALESPLEVAVAMCRQSMGFVPDTIRQRVFEAENAEVIAATRAHREERDATEAKAKARSDKAAATRAATSAREAEREKAAVRSATCPSCFQIRSASGVCGCD
jgi:uncharacterized protein (DUF1800 family)